MMHSGVVTTMNEYSWAKDSLSEAHLSAELQAGLGHIAPQVPTAHGPELKNFQQRPWQEIPPSCHESLLEARCAIEYVATNAYDLNHQIEVQTCAYPWWHWGEHGTEVPELWQEWNAIQAQIERQEYYG